LSDPFSSQKDENVKKEHQMKNHNISKETSAENSKGKIIIKTYSGSILEYSKRQKLIARSLYISIVISILISVGGFALAIAEIFQPSGKWTAFVSASLGLKIIIIAGLLAGLFFFLLLFYSLAKKGVDHVLKITCLKKDYDEKYKGRNNVKIGAGALMLSLFAILIGIVYLIIEEFIVTPTGEGNFLSFLISLSGGQLLIFIGVGLLTINGLLFGLNYLWYNGYYLILRMIGGLEK